jgi:hypothetical protein
MSGVNRNILAELTAKGTTGEAAMKAFSPAGILEEKGEADNTGEEKHTGSSNE